MKGIRMDVVRIFVENGIQTSADFKIGQKKEIPLFEGSWSCHCSEVKGKWDKV